MSYDMKSEGSGAQDWELERESTTGFVASEKPCDFYTGAFTIRGGEWETPEGHGMKKAF